LALDTQGKVIDCQRDFAAREAVDQRRYRDLLTPGDGNEAPCIGCQALGGCQSP